MQKAYLQLGNPALTQAAYMHVFITNLGTNHRVLACKFACTRGRETTLKSFMSVNVSTHPSSASLAGAALEGACTMLIAAKRFLTKYLTCVMPLAQVKPGREERKQKAKVEELGVLQRGWSSLEQ